MRFPEVPDLTRPKWLALLALAVAVIATTALYMQDYKWLPAALGDTDDATRLVMVRELLAGRGWWDQHFLRYQPPVGVYMHWSRLLDGGIALLTLVFRLFTDSQTAEMATRIVWPALWIIVAAGAVLKAAHTLAFAQGDKAAGRRAVVICAVLCAFNLTLYGQFHPGRVDHHNAQIALTLVALTGAMQPTQNRRAAWIAGIAAGLGLAVGLEALFFQVLIAVVMALRFALKPSARRWISAYAIALGATTVLAYAIQTPPWRWSLSACDALGFNLTAAVAVGSAALLAAMRATEKLDSRFRVLGMGLAGAAALAVYLGLEPNCIHGPFADVDMRIRSFWLDHVSEVANLPLLYTRHPEDAITLVVTFALGILSWAGLSLQGGRLSDGAWWVLGLNILLGIAVGSMAVRMGAYATWFAVPAIAAVAAWLAGRYEARLGLVASLGAALLLAPMGWSGLAMGANNAMPKVRAMLAPQKPGGGSAAPARAEVATKAKAKAPADFCFNAFAYKDLAAAPKGLTLSEIDLGPFVVAHTPSSSLSAPYHRLSWGIMAARSVLIAPADAAYDLARRHGVTYVLECPLHANHADRTGLSKDSLQVRLDHGTPPTWLVRISPANAPVIVYRVAAPAKTQ